MTLAEENMWRMDCTVQPTDLSTSRPCKLPPLQKIPLHHVTEGTTTYLPALDTDALCGSRKLLNLCRSCPFSPGKCRLSEQLPHRLLSKLNGIPKRTEPREHEKQINIHNFLLLFNQTYFLAKKNIYYKVNTLKIGYPFLSCPITKFILPSKIMFLCFKEPSAMSTLRLSCFRRYRWLCG